METAITHAIETYHELNTSSIDELSEEPRPLEFSRFVARNRPFVVRRAAANWTAVKKWNASYLRDIMAGGKVNVATTPYGNADAVVERQNGPLAFVEPYETQEPFGEFLDYLQAEAKTCSSKRRSKSVKYAQTQNDNLRKDYSKLYSDVPTDVPFARIALEKEADAVNMWIGNERSVTALHKDNYENIYVQIRGQKHFVLLPPVEMPCVNEQCLPHARYQPASELDQGAESDLIIETKDNIELVPVPTWDPDEPEARATLYSHLSQPSRVTLEEGDMLHLPAMWYHKVRQSSGAEGFACSVNYWYDMEFSGGFWTANSFMRDAALVSAREIRYPPLVTGEEP